jgi:hypothetical protein
VAKGRGDEIHFLGLGTTKTPDLNVFETTSMLRKLNNREVALDKSIRKEWADAIHKIEPDIIHANDIIAAIFSSDLEIPMVYDDHEYWSEQRVAYESWPFLWKIRSRPFLQAIPRWEKELVTKHVSITVSEGIAEEHRQISDRVFVLQNYCLRSEVEHLPQNPHRQGIVYVGDDFRKKKFLPHRDLTGLKDYLEFDDITGLSRTELYQRLIEYRFGLLPFRPISYHKYSNSAKLFDYLNCGLQVILTQKLFVSHGKLPFTIPFNDYSELPALVTNTPSAEPKEIMKFAHNNLVWEAQQDKLFEAYRIAMENS